VKLIAYVLASLLDIYAQRACAGDIERDIARRGCAALTRRVDAIASGAGLLRSYDAADGTDPVSPPLRTAAFVYDNSLAVIALISCGDVPRASRVGEALRLAVEHDTRLRNVYRAGAAETTPLQNGWWDAKASQWQEDRDQNGTTTGNAAWTGLAMLALFERDRDVKWSQAAAKLGRWIVDNTSNSTPGFTDGIDGFDAAPVHVTWKSTEHNIDAEAFFRRLADDRVPGDWKLAESSAHRFVTMQWDATTGHFFIGTLADGATPNRNTSALDAQVWPLLLLDAPKDWQRSLAYIEREHAVSGGFDFNADRDGAWIEATAQAALAYRRVGRTAEAKPLLVTIAAQFSKSGYVYATREPRVSTGLSTTPGGGGQDFYYFHVPHLAATAWAILAATETNPYARRN
jgi:hypothetical protein